MYIVGNLNCRNYYILQKKKLIFIIFTHYDIAWKFIFIDYIVITFCFVFPVISQLTTVIFTSLSWSLWVCGRWSINLYRDIQCIENLTLYKLTVLNCSAKTHLHFPSFPKIIVMHVVEIIPWCPVYQHASILIASWISNYKAWDEITYSFSTFNGAAVEVGNA